MPFTPTAPDTTVVDLSHGKGSQDYTLTVIATIGADTVRARITVDSYERQSHAVAEVLSAQRIWTNLLNEPTDAWYAHATGPYSDRSGQIATAEELADRLLFRAQRVLAAATIAAGTR